MVAPLSHTVGVSEGEDIILELFVEVHTVGDNDDAVEERLCPSSECHELISQPGDAVGFARTCGVLNEEALSHLSLASGAEEGAHHLELVPARPDADFGGVDFAVGVFVFAHQHLGVVLQNVA